MRRKITVLMLCIVLVALQLAGCGMGQPARDGFQEKVAAFKAEIQAASDGEQKKK